MVSALAFVLGVIEAALLHRLMRSKGADTLEEFIGRATLEEMWLAQGHAQAGLLLWGLAAILSVMRL